MKTKLTLSLVALITSSAFAAIPKVLPEFKNAEQLAEWREEMAAKHAATTATDDHAFYTGKPYIESTGSYAFKYRSYNPELARWTCEDPSGFPDGANGNIYAPTPISELDFLGLWKIKVITPLNSGNSVQWVDQSLDLSVGGALTSSIGNGTTASSITVNGVAAAQLGFVGDPNFDNRTIEQTYTINVDSNGNLSVDENGTAMYHPNNLGIGINGSRTINGSSLTLSYAVSGAHGGNGNLTGIGFQILAFGASGSWENSTNTLAGSVSITFEAVE